MADTLNLDNNQRRNFDEWFQSDDMTPQGFFQSLGLAAGTGKYRPKEDLEPSFLDKFADHFGVQTDRAKEIKELSAKQQQLMPFAEKVLQAKVLRMANERYMPRDTGQAPEVMRSLAIAPGSGDAGAAPQPFMGGQAAAQPSGLATAPDLGLPAGASSEVAAAGPQLGPVDPNPVIENVNSIGASVPPPDKEFTPIIDPNAPPQYDYQGRLIPAPQQKDLIEQPVRPEQIAAPIPRAPIPGPPPVRLLEPWERKAAYDMIQARAGGHLLPDETGRLVPASLVAGENRMLKGPEIEAAGQLYGVNGLQVAPNTRLPAATVQNAFAQRLKTTHENMPEIVKLQAQAQKLPEGSPDRLKLEDRINRLATNGTSNIDDVAAAQAEFAALPSHLQTSQNAAAIAKQHKGVLTKDVLEGIKNPNQPLVNVNTGVTASEEASKEFMKSTRATYDQLKSAPTALANIEIAKTLIPSAKGFMGPGGETLLDAAKFLNNRLGTKIDTTGIKDAEELRSRIFFNIMDSLKKMDAQPSELQQRVMMDSLGKLGTDPNALGNVLDAFADSIRGKVEQHNSEVSSAESRGTRFPYNPIIKLPEKKAAAMQSTGAAEAYKDPNKEARYQEWKRRQAQ